ncbi:MAG TPA: glycosyltransferase family 2 protein [Kiritimatiellia bacterium]|nr:glycosyltransferase family 2 protein [Kiritimatiellia bacterium]
MKLSVITHTRNSAQDLRRLLECIRWVDEVIIVDMHSADGTRELAERSGARVFDIDPTPRVDGIRNQFLNEASHPWILVLDSDEYLSHDAEPLVRSLMTECSGRYDAVAIPRFNRIGNYVMRGSGWYPDHQIRLFVKGTVRWADAIHRPPSIITGDERLLRLQPPNCLHIHHDNYENLAEFIRRQVEYALSDTYNKDPSLFRPEDCSAKAYAEFAFRHDRENDGDISTALATLMAWDKIVRCIVHWDSLSPKPSLEKFFTLPITTSIPDEQLRGQLAARDRRIAELEDALRKMRSSRLLRLATWFDRTFPATSRSVARLARRPRS